MRLCLSGIQRKTHMDAIIGSGCKSFVVDYWAKGTRGFLEHEKLSREDTFIIVEFSLKRAWNTNKYAWGGINATEAQKKKLKKEREKYGGEREVRELALGRIDALVEEYFVWCDQNRERIDIVSLPYIPVDSGMRWESLLSKYDLREKGMLTITNLDELKLYIPKFRFLAISKEVKDKELRAQIAPLIPLLRVYKCLLHGWGRGDKESAVTGLFHSVSCGSWLANTRFGSTYQYVGSSKIIHHNKGETRKQIRKQLKSQCLSLEIDYEKFLEGDPDTVNLWSALQWVAYAQDLSFVSGYWGKQEPANTSELTGKSDKNGVERAPQKTSLASGEAGVGYLRDCNSCYLSSQCPAFSQDANCSISTRPKVDTPEDLQDLLNRVIQIQGERVLFAAFAEKTQNMGLNPEVSKEMASLTQVIKDSKEILSPTSDEVTIKAKGSGIISTLFGGYGRSGSGTKPSQSERIIDVSPLDEDI